MFFSHCSRPVLNRIVTKHSIEVRNRILVHLLLPFTQRYQTTFHLPHIDLLTTPIIQLSNMVDCPKCGAQADLTPDKSNAHCASCKFAALLVPLYPIPSLFALILPIANTHITTTGQKCSPLVHRQQHLRTRQARLWRAGKRIRLRRQGCDQGKL